MRPITGQGSADMSAYERLGEATRREREFLLASPPIRDALAGSISLPRYLAFLSQAFHHVRHTVPLLMAAGSRLPSRLQLDAEGHDSLPRGGSRSRRLDPQRHHAPPAAMSPASVHRCPTRPPMRWSPTFTTRSSGAIRWASSAWCSCSRAPASRWRWTRPTGSRHALGLPDSAFTYLRSHGQLDQQHVGDLQGILDRLTDPGGSGGRRPVRAASCSGSTATCSAASMTLPVPLADTARRGESA